MFSTRLNNYITLFIVISVCLLSFVCWRYVNSCRHWEKCKMVLVIKHFNIYNNRKGFDWNQYVKKDKLLIFSDCSILYIIFKICVKVVIMERVLQVTDCRRIWTHITQTTFENNEEKENCLSWEISLFAKMCF